MSDGAQKAQRIAFLLAQVGAHASERFAARVRELGLSPSEAAVLRLVGRAPGLSQRTIAARVGTVPSRVVNLIDGLELRGLVTRTRSATDRRNYELHLTAKGGRVLAALREVAEAHEAEIRAGLTAEEAANLAGALKTLARAHGLDLDLHAQTGAEKAPEDQGRQGLRAMP